MNIVPFLAKKKQQPPAPQARRVRGSSSLGTPYRNKRELNKALWLAYRNNPWAYRAVRSIAGALSKGYELIAKDDQLDVLELPELHEFLQHPNATDSFEELVGNIVTQMLVFGVCYLEVQRQGLTAEQATVLVQKALTGNAELVPEMQLELDDVVQAAIVNGIPTAMQVLPAQQMEVLTDKLGNITGFKQQTDDGRNIIFQPHEVVIMLHPGSMDKHYGDSPLEPISNSITNDTLIRQRQQAKLLNAIALQHVFHLPENTSDADVDRFHEQLSQMYRGATNAGAFIVTNNPVKVEQMDDAAEGDFLQLREAHKEEIAMTLGVPLSVLGTTDGNSLNGAGSEQHYRAFIENTCRPLARHIQADLNALIVEPYEQLGAQNVMLHLVLEDTDDDQAREELYNTCLENGSMSINEVRAKRGMNPIPGGDECYINAKGVQLVSQLGVVTQPQLPVPQDDEDEEEQQAIKALKALQRTLRKQLR